MTNKKIPFTKKQIEHIIQEYPTPFHIYDEKGIRKNAQKFYQAFRWIEGGFKNFYAVKACPNPYILKILRDEGMGVDCSSMAELILAERVGFRGEEIMFTSNETPIKEYTKAIEMGAIINLDDLSHIEYLEKNIGQLPETLCFRFNPGLERTGNVLIGNPVEAKYGLTRVQLFKAYTIAKKKGVKRFGLHTMVASNELNTDYFIETARMLFEVVNEIYKLLDIKMEFINLGGGIGIPYQPDQRAVDLKKVSQGIKKLYRQLIQSNKLTPLKIVMECGRMVTGPFGYLVTEVLHKKEIYKNYIGIDASMANLMRPGMYGAYHHITVLGKEQRVRANLYDVVGSLCENNDKFAIDRRLPVIDIGDILIIHDTGAHGHAMGFNYNGKLRSAELLFTSDSRVQLIRRSETIDDYFKTLDFSDLD